MDQPLEEQKDVVAEVQPLEVQKDVVAEVQLLEEQVDVEAFTISQEQQIAKLIDEIVRIDDTFEAPSKHLGYGTAGFRANASLLTRASFRVGLVVAMRARGVGKCGIMVTASHNHHVDNGVKIIEPDGSMLVPDWELFSEMIVNSKDLRE